MAKRKSVGVKIAVIDCSEEFTGASDSEIIKRFSCFDWVLGTKRVGKGIVHLVYLDVDDVSEHINEILEGLALGINEIYTPADLAATAKVEKRNDEF